MAGKTTHYGLSLPEAWDRRSAGATRADHAALDEAIHAAYTELEDVRYNLYNLMLREDYEGKTTGYRKALYFDSFQNNRQLESIDLGLLFHYDTRSLWLTGQGEESGIYGTVGTRSRVEDKLDTWWSWKPVGSGRLTGLTFYFSGVMRVELYQIDRTGRETLVSGTALTGKGTNSVLWPVSASICAGATYEIRCTNPEGAPVTFYYGDNPTGSTHWLVIRRDVTPEPILRGRATSVWLTPGECGRARAWVRYDRGRVSLAVDGGSGWREMALEETRDTVEPWQGTVCKESAFFLSGLSGESFRFRLDVDSEGPGEIHVFDYGVSLS